MVGWKWWGDFTSLSPTSETTTQFDENCITETHFGNVKFEDFGGTFPATKLEKTRLDDFITIEDLHHCKKECASIAGCYQERLKKNLFYDFRCFFKSRKIHYSDDGCYIFGDLEEIEGETFSTKLENCGEWPEINAKG